MEKKNQDVDSRSTRLLWDLRIALLRALSASRDSRNVLDRVREEGWSVYLTIEQDTPGVESKALPLSPAIPGNKTEFKINYRDLSLLRSLGIDPTRTLRRRRRA